MFFFFKQKTAYEMRISDWSSDVCSSDLQQVLHLGEVLTEGHHLLARCTQFGNGRGDLADRGVAGEAHAVHAQQHAFDAVVGARLVECAQQVAQLHFMHAGAAEGAERTHARVDAVLLDQHALRSEEHTSELQSLMRISYA